MRKGIIQCGRKERDDSRDDEGDVYANADILNHTSRPLERFKAYSDGLHRIQYLEKSKE